MLFNVVVFLVFNIVSAQVPPDGGFLKREYSLTKPFSGKTVKVVWQW